MKFEVGFSSNQGLKRESNQDYGLYDCDQGVFVVADGMGGHQGGQVASKMASEIIVAEIKKQDPQRPLVDD